MMFENDVGLQLLPWRECKKKGNDSGKFLKNLKKVVPRFQQSLLSGTHSFCARNRPKENNRRLGVDSAAS